MSDQPLPTLLLVPPDDPMLRAKAAIFEPDEFGKKLRALSKEVVQAMVEYDGAGLAAPQVGIGKRMFVARMSNGEILVACNPVIYQKSTAKVYKVEGCLSIPGVEVEVSRSLSIKLVYRDPMNRVKVQTFTKQDARVIQHEVDHLDGVLITDYLQKGSTIGS